MFKPGDKVTINLIGGNIMKNANILEWETYGIRFTWMGKTHFMPWSSIWSVTKPAQEAIDHAETV